MQLAAARALVSVPGKVILMGEHAAVYGRPAVVAAVGMRLRAALVATGEPGVRLDLPGLAQPYALTWSEIHDRVRAARTAWERYESDPTPATFAALRGRHPGDLAALAVGESARAMQSDRVEWPGLSLQIESELPVGAGFGSSAAAAFAIVTATTAILRGGPDWALIQRTVLEVERRQHGSPSGVDAATVFHGGVLHAVRTEGGLDAEPLSANPGQLAAIRVLTTGSPPDSTGEVVAAVRQRRDADTAAFAAVLDRMQEHTEAFSAALTRADAVAADLIDPVRGYHRCLCEIGVVPEPVRARVEAIEAAGGAAKVSGAGSSTGPAAGSLLVIDPPARSGAGVAATGDLIEYPVALGVEGVRLEKLEPVH